MPFKQILEHENEINQPLLIMINHIRNQLIFDLEAELIKHALIEKHPIRQFLLAIRAARYIVRCD